jgi:thymidine kinase
MNSGKSTSLIQVAYNYQETGQRPFVIKPRVDTKHSKVLSRIGASLVVDFQSNNSDNLFTIVKNAHQTSSIECVLVEEVQFLTREQANQLLEITIKLDIPVIAYGLRTDFLGVAFPGSQRLLEIAQVIEEIRTKCWLCKSKANFNARVLPDGTYMTQGQQILIDDGTQVQYIPLCANHFVKLIGIR